MAQMVITAVGADRPGLVGQFTGHLHQAGVNIADSRMINLRGQFAVLLLVEGPAGKIEALAGSAAAAGAAIGLQVTVTPTPSVALTAPATAAIPASGGGTGPKAFDFAQAGRHGVGASGGGSSGGGASGGVPYKLKTYSMDQPGIVHRVTTVLATFGVNIEELQTRQESAPFAGTELFTLEARLTVPGTVAIRQLRAALEELCAQLNCDMDLEPA